MSVLPNWTWDQYNAAAKVALGYVGGAVSVGAAWGIVSQNDATGIVSNLNLIVHGLGEVAAGVAGLAATGGALYTGWRGIVKSSPNEQMHSVVTNLEAPKVAQAVQAVEDPSARNKLINAVGEMPEVKKIVADSDVALGTNSPKVVGG